MCLVKKSIFPRFTLEDKIVYKIVYEHNILGVYRTPYQHQVITFNREYKGEWFYDDFIESLFASEISEGYIHSIKDLESAELYIRRTPFCKPVYILKAVIPKYTFYWEGKNNDIASRRIKYINEVCKIHGNRTEYIY